MQRTTTMITRVMLVGLGSLALSIGTALPALADSRHNHDRDECNTRTLKGTYVFTQDGFENRRVLTSTLPVGTPTALVPADRRPFGYAGRETYDGRGNVAGINTVAQARGATANPPTPPATLAPPVAVDPFVEYSGTYEVSENCTAVVTLPEGDFQSIYHLFLSPDGEKFSFILYSTEVRSGGVVTEAFELTGVGVAYRVGD